MKHTPSLALALALLSGCAGESPSPASAPSPLRTPTVATRSGTFQNPLDAAPSPDGATVFFVARGGERGAGLYRVAAEGGAAAEVAVGAPFATPRGLALSNDGQRIVVADATAGLRGGLYVVPASGGAPTLLAGTEGTAPQGLEVVAQGGVEQVIFTGSASDGTAAVFQIPLAGGALTTVARGGMLHHPQGVAVARTGTIYVADRTTPEVGLGAVLRIEGGIVTSVINNVRLGDPAGLALSPDERTLGVSSLSPTAGTCQVLLLDLASGMSSAFSDVIRANRAAGGVHRAHGGTSTDLAWSDLTAGDRGIVYRIQFQ